MAAQAKAPVSRKRALSAAPPPSFEACVVTYISQDRAFQRVFAEADIEGMKKVVREKLNLAPNAGVRLAQVAEGRRIDLEDDADFYAFQLGARLKPELQVEVSVIAAPAAQLASPSVTATSINLERAPPPAPTQTGKGETSQTADGSTSVPPAPNKKKKPRKSNLIIIDNEAEQRGSKPTGPVESTANEQVPKAPKSKAKEADPVPLTTNAQPAKKPKSKAKSIPPADQPVPGIRGESKQHNDITTEASNVPPKSKKGKKAATGTTPAPEPTSVPTTESIPETSPADTEIPQSRPKKRGRKAAQDGEQDIPAPETTKTAGPPVKKQRTSADADVDMGSGAQSPVATTLPPPVRSERRNSTVLSIPDPDKPVSSVGSAADILRRWGAKSAATQVASGDGPSTTTDVADQDAETKLKPKRKRKKKDQAADDTSTTASIPAPTPEATQCLVCISGPHEPSDCALLSKRDSETAKMIEERIQNLEDTQGPARIHQMLIGTLRRWLKDTKKQVEAQNVSITPTPVPTPIPTRPKKSKLSSVAVSQQSEGSSTEDEDILKSVMESRIESDEEDGGEDGEEDEDEEMADTSLPKLEFKPELEQTMTPVHTPTPTPSPKHASIPLPPSSPTTKALLQSQRMSQSGVRALLDGLESEEAGDGEEENSDEEGSDLAQSTPSDVARRRHRKTVRLDVQDSDEEATVRAHAQVQDEGSDVEMRDSEERDLATLSQLLDSSQHIPEEIVGVVGEEDDEDDIEEYEDEKDKSGQEAPDGEAGSPIESPDREPVAAEEEVAETAQEEESEPLQEGEDEDEDEDEDESEPEVKPVQESETVAPAPKKRGRPPLPQSVKDERAAEKARIQAEKIALQGGDPSVPRKRGRPRKSQPVEGDTSTSGKPESAVPATQTPEGSQGPRPRGRPRLSDTVRAEREAANERIRAEKAIQKLEKRTAKADAKVASKGKGANATTPADHEESGEKDGDSTVQRSPHVEEATESPVVPAWSTLKNPSSSRPGSSQADEIEWSATEAGEDGTNKRPSGSQPSASKPTPDTRAKKGSAPSKPLFMPSSGLGQRFLPALSPLTSTPIPSKLLSLSQQTPSNALQRRRSIGSASAPRFTEIRKTHDLQQRSRKERNKSLSSQPIALNSSQSLKSKPNGADGVVDIESSDEEVDSSADEAKKLGPSSQRKKKRPSAFAYFDQS
ncbi:unnamed protein product [Rhizoctonia solani]|uniref:Uncharacterized protein n=1 Tax=Rhizoctonia solani TaxID=456999 RepID=A0A8H2WZL9_9AGAM|nr:unnamed protein product [Rhizoctonia solani]